MRNSGRSGNPPGYWALTINQYFSDRKLYLFDTFDGFAEADLLTEKNVNDRINGTVFLERGQFQNTSTDYVMRKMVHPGQVVLCKGWFPETAKPYENQKFAFVSLDMDLYEPMFAALKWFWDRMSMGGMLLLHDYGDPVLQGVKKAVEDFENELGDTVCKSMAGDRTSLVIVKR